MSAHDALHRRALETAPGGVHSPVRSFRGVGGTPVFIASAAGARLTDVDGRTYIDFCLSFGPLILGTFDYPSNTFIDEVRWEPADTTPVEERKPEGKANNPTEGLPILPV